MTFEARNLRRTIDGRTLFAGLSFQLEAGQTLVVQGPSGAGKTLLLRQLAGLDPLEAGDVLLDHRSIRQVPSTAWRVKVTWVAQAPQVFRGSPADLALRIDRLATQRARVTDDATEIARNLGLGDAWTRPWAQISGGERQRAMLAIALSRRPEVLLLDEPTSALDSDARDRVEAAVRGHTTVWVTHDRAQAERVADAIVEIAPGGEG